MGCFVAQGFSRSVVESMRGASNLPAFDVGEVAVLGEVLTHESVGVLVETPFPGAIGMREEEVGVQGGGNGFVVRELRTVVGGDREDLLGIGRQRPADSLADGTRAATPALAQQGVFRAALHERDERAPAAGTDHGIGFPVAHAAFVIDRRRAILDGYPVGDGPASVVGPVTLAPRLLAAQVPMEMAARAFVRIDVPVDPLVADDDPILRLEPSARLLGAPVAAEQSLDACPIAWREPGADLGRAPRHGQGVCLLRPVAARPAVAAELTTHGGLVRPDLTCDLGLIPSGFHTGMNLISLFMGELRVGFHRCSFDLAV